LPCVIDADAIHAVALDKEVLKNKRFVITPHAHEFKLLSGVDVNTDLRKRIIAIKKVARDLKTTIILKGHVDIISDVKRTATNKSGSAYLTKGGCGDTLAGICGALLARGVDTFTAACAATYINGRAGELAAKKFGEGLLATDLIDSIPDAIG
jgi:hydroxyethylthiazole kinase-like uncharacterized protein yjeF